MKWISFIDGFQSSIQLDFFEIIFDISMEVDGWRLQITLSSEKMEADNYDCLVYEKKMMMDEEHAKREAYSWISAFQEKIKKIL
jgi:outer membrane cobalamin receptor